MAIKSINLPDGTTVDIDEWLHWPAYSTLECASTAALNLRIFTYVVGQRVPGQGTTARNATDADTNWIAKARVNHDEAYIFFNWTFEHFALEGSDVSTGSPAVDVGSAPQLTAGNLRRLGRDVVCELVVGAGIDKPMARSPLSYLMQGPGAPAFPGGATPVSAGTSGLPSPRNQRRWNLPVFVESDRVMFMKVFSPIGTITGLSQDFRLRFYLDGLKRRPVA